MSIRGKRGKLFFIKGAIGFPSLKLLLIVNGMVFQCRHRVYKNKLIFSCHAAVSRYASKQCQVHQGKLWRTVQKGPWVNVEWFCNKTVTQGVEFCFKRLDRRQSRTGGWHENPTITELNKTNSGYFFKWRMVYLQLDFLAVGLRFIALPV